MDVRDKKLIEKLDNDFHQLSSQEGWEPQDIELMKDLQKLMYYMEVRCAMKEGEEYRNDPYEMENNRSYGMYGGRYYNDGGMSGRNSYARGGNRGSNGRMNYGNSYAGRRYYDSEKENSMNDLRQMISMEQDPEKRSMLENIMHTLENDK